MKRYLRYILIILIIITSVCTYKYFTKKNLVIKVTNGITVDDKAPSLIKGILQEKYRIKYSNTNYNMIIDLPYNNPNRDFQAAESMDPKIIKIFYTPEAVLPNLNNYDLVIGFDHLDDPKYIRVPWYYQYKYNKKIHTAYNKNSDLGQCQPKKPYFACFLVSNNTTGKNFCNHKDFDGCTARAKFFEDLSQYKQVESGGKYANNVGGPVQDTMGWMSQCKFVIAYENQSYNGYITEKPFQAYFAGAIPIYYGDRTAVLDMNPKAIIYTKDFQSNADLIEYIKKIDNDDKLYCDIWNQNIVNDSSRNYDTVRQELKTKLYKIIDAKLNK